MAQQKPPAPSGSPPVASPSHQHHHPVLGAAAPGTHTDDQVDPEDFKDPLIADLLTGHLPGKIMEVNKRPEAAPEEVTKDPVFMVPAAYVAQMCQEISDGFLKDPASLPGAVKKVLDLWMLRDGIDVTALPVALPYNSGQVRAGGHALFRTATTMDDARPLKVDLPGLGRDLAQIERVRRFRAVIDPPGEVLAANDSQGLKRVATRVQGALGLGMSLIRANGELQRALMPALAIKGDPVEAGLQSRGHNARTEAQIRADEQAKLEAQGAGDAPKAGTLTTVTTEVPGPASPSGVLPRSPTTRGHGTKKGA